MEQGDNGNGRVTMAVLGQKMDEVKRQNDRIERCVEELERRMREMERTGSVYDSRIDGLEDDMSTLKTRNTLGDAITGVMAVVAGIIGYNR